jgi:hypothetical protein
MPHFNIWSNWPLCRQYEVSSKTNFIHYQVHCYFKSKYGKLGTIKQVFLLKAEGYLLSIMALEIAE